MLNTDDTISIPLMPLRDIVIFPNMVVPLFVGREKSVIAIEKAMSEGHEIFLASQKDANVDEPDINDIYHIGTIGTILQLLRLPDGTVKILIEGRNRGRILRFLPQKDFFAVELEILKTVSAEGPKIDALIRMTVEAFDDYVKLNKKIPPEVAVSISLISDPDRLADTIAGHIPFKVRDKQRLLETLDAAKRLERLYTMMKSEAKIVQMEQKIRERVKKQVERTQREFYLNEQLRAIQKEMGHKDDVQTDIQDLERKIKKKRLPREAAQRVRQEFKKLKLMAPMSAEATVVRNYIDWILTLPWFERTKDKHDIKEAEKILNEDHYGLEKPKERILEYLAVQSLVKKMKGPILCLVGPPGVGKTSLAKSVARALGRHFVRLSLGGVRDEAEIRGHRRTYIGAMPGKIIQSLKKAKTSNPVFCLDEVDKMSADFRGDPSAALLEVLDPEQNHTFNDHYLDLDYDLSEVLFITTANALHTIPLPLQDRMEIIEIAGYTEEEKIEIVRGYLIPRQLEAHGLRPEYVQFSQGALSEIIRSYTREAGVRNLERSIATILRKVAREFVQSEQDKDKWHIKIGQNSTFKYLGVPKYKKKETEENDLVGVATGLAWTETGGTILHIEASIMPGKGQLTITGKLGDVMQESVQAAMSYVRSRAYQFDLPWDFYQKIDIHVHVPEGAIPKDGPSAGITIASAIISALLKIPIRHEIAMTGEITLRGRVLGIGGLKEKLLAAKRMGIKNVVIPSENEKDLKEIPNKITKALNITLIEHMDDVLINALKIDDPKTLFKTPSPQDAPDLFSIIQQQKAMEEIRPH